MKRYLLLLLTLLSFLLTACGQIEVGVEVTPTVAVQATQSPTSAPTPVPPTAMPTPPQLVRGNCPVVYADNSVQGSFLYCLDAHDERFQVVDASQLGTLSAPQISPDGKQVAYLVNKIDGTSELWIVNVGTLPTLEQPRLLVGRANLDLGGPEVINSPLKFQWQIGTQTIFFSTRFMPVQGIQGPGEYINADLWKVDAESGALSNVLAPQSAGSFTFSPDGRFIAISNPRSIALLKTDGSPLQVLLDFPFINTASEYTYKPLIGWSADSTFFYTAIPSAEPFAADAYAEVYRMGVDGTTRKTATISGNLLFGAPTFAPDGEHILYSQYDQVAGTNILYQMRSDGSAKQQVGTPMTDIWGWSPDANDFVYSWHDGQSGGVVTVVDATGAHTPLMPKITLVSLRWIDNTTFYFHGAVEEEWGLYVYRLGGEIRRVATVPDATTSFDAR